MFIEFDVQKLKTFLDSDVDSEEISAGEYVADVYDIERPLTLNLALKKTGFEVLAAAYLKYDEEQDGWYMADRCEDAAEIKAAFNRRVYG